MNAVAAPGGAHRPGLSLVLDAAPAPAPAQVATELAGTQPAPAAQPAAPTAAATESSGSAPIKRAYPAPAELPTQEGPKGLRFDFNDGCRVHLPEGEHPWRVRLTDLDTGNVLFETEIK